MHAAQRVKNEAQDNDLLERLASDPEIPLSRDEIQSLMDVRNFIGRAPEQVTEFIVAHMRPVMEKYAEILGERSEVRV